MNFINGVLSISEQFGTTPDVLMILSPLSFIMAYHFVGWCFHQLTRVLAWTLRKLSRTVRRLLIRKKLS